MGVAQGDLYYIQDEAQESLPLKWTAGVNLTYDSNVNPTAVVIGADEDATSINPFVGLSFVSISPQTTWDVYARLGGIYYFDSPSALGSDDFYTQARLGVNWTHRVSERLRFSSRNTLSYELEPDYAYGVATTRQLGEYFYWMSDNSVGYRWTERFATYTGISFSGLDYDQNVNSQDRSTWTAYNQFRYQLTPQTVLTGEYRYASTSAGGIASDYTDQYILVGAEHRFSPNTIMVVRGGVQLHDVDGFAGGDSTSPYLETTVRTQVNDQFSVRGFLRYGVEGYDTIRAVGAGVYQFDDRKTLRLGLSSEYAVSPMFTIFGGLDYIPATFDDGQVMNQTTPATLPNGVGGLSEDLINLYVGLSVKFNDMLYGTVSYNYTDSSSDFLGQSYDRNRVSVGVRAEF